MDSFYIRPESCFHAHIHRIYRPNPSTETHSFSQTFKMNRIGLKKLKSEVSGVIIVELFNTSTYWVVMSNDMKGVTARHQCLLVSASPGCIGLRWSEWASRSCDRPGHGEGCRMITAKERERRWCVAATMAWQKDLDVADLLSQTERSTFSCFSESNIVYLQDRFLVVWQTRWPH